MKLELMQLIGFSEREADIVVETYRCNGELDDLAAVIETKQEACSRLI